MAGNLSIIVITRNAPRATEMCLRSLLFCQKALESRGGGDEFILADENWSTGPVAEQQHQEMLHHTREAYTLFRQKWGETLLPEDSRTLIAAHYRALRSAPAPPGGDFQPPLQLIDDIAQQV